MLKSVSEFSYFTKKGGREKVTFKKFQTAVITYWVVVRK